mgnify:CR=1 FL=1
MSFISVFDVLGPNMIGPSSSHTAGAASIGLFVSKMFARPIKKLYLRCMDLLRRRIRDMEQTGLCSAACSGLRPTTRGSGMRLPLQKKEGSHMSS